MKVSNNKNPLGCYKVEFEYNPAIKQFDKNLEVNREEQTITSVGVLGTFLFYQSKMTGHTNLTGMKEKYDRYIPAKYSGDMANIAGNYYQEMKINENGIFSTILYLPAGLYQYRLIINGKLKISEDSSSPEVFLAQDGKLYTFEQSISDMIECGKIIKDPMNLPDAPVCDGEQQCSCLVVGNANDHSWLPCQNSIKKGMVTFVSYRDIDQKQRSLGVYLPFGYNRKKVYPVIYLSHGGFGNEVDWFYQGMAQNTMDNLIAAGKCREAILVTMNNEVYKNGRYSWDYRKISENMIQRVEPFIESIFSVSPKRENHAFCGLSLGSITTMYMYMHYPERYHNYGVFSGGLAGGLDFTLENPLLKDCRLVIGCAEQDIAYNDSEIGIPSTIKKLKENQLPFDSYFVTGSHDWYCWTQMFEYFVQKIL